MTTILLTLQNWKEANQGDIRNISSIIINRILKVVILSSLSKYTYCTTSEHNYTKIFLVTTKSNLFFRTKKTIAIQHETDSVIMTRLLFESVCRTPEYIRHSMRNNRFHQNVKNRSDKG